MADENDRLLEDEAAYTNRMERLLPNFPPDVLGQWFFDHWMQIGNNSWLNYPSLRFKAVHWTTAEVPLENFGHEELLASRIRFFQSEQELPRRHQRLLTYMRNEGTWPRAIIVLDIETPLPERPAWLSTGRYELLEGHNRVAAFRFLRNTVQLQPRRSVWLVSCAAAA